MSKLHVINSGRADCFVLEIEANGETEIIVIDGGTKTYDKRRPLTEFLNNRSIKKVNYLILTHFHQDHFGGFSTLPNDIQIENAIIPFPSQKLRSFVMDHEREDNQFEEYEKFYHNLLSQKTRLITTMNESNQQVIFGDYKLACLYFVDDHRSKVNSYLQKMNSFHEKNDEFLYYYQLFKAHCNKESSIWVLEKNNKCIALFLGDSPLDVVNPILEVYQKQPTILKVSHHGIGKAYYSCQQIEQLKPDHLIVTTDEENKPIFLQEINETVKALNMTIDIPYEKGDYYYDI